VVHRRTPSDVTSVPGYVAASAIGLPIEHGTAVQAVAGGACVSRGLRVELQGRSRAVVCRQSPAGKAKSHKQFGAGQTYSDTVLRTNCRTILSGREDQSSYERQYVLMGMAAVLGSLEAVAQAYPSKLFT